MILIKAFWFIYYIFMTLIGLLKAVVKASIRVSKSSVHAYTEYMELRTDIKSHFGLVMLANAITLSPGMLVLEIDPESGRILIECLKKDYAQARFEKLQSILKKVLI
jgi:multisubunit Na+/H+ antiporter MnhE subunit